MVNAMEREAGHPSLYSVWEPVQISGSTPRSDAGFVSLAGIIELVIAACNQWPVNRYAPRSTNPWLLVDYPSVEPQ